MITATQRGSTQVSRYLGTGERTTVTIDSARPANPVRHADDLAVVDGRREVRYAQLQAMIRQAAALPDFAAMNSVRGPSNAFQKFIADAVASDSLVEFRSMGVDATPLSATLSISNSQIISTPGLSAPEGTAMDTPVVDELEVLVVGGGFSGSYQLDRLRGLGYSVKTYEAGSRLGGVWHWNAHPGARVDTYAPIHQFSREDIWRDWN